MGQVPVVGSTTGETTLGVTGVVMDDTGIDYLPTPDGSQGGDGNVWAESDETTVKRSDGRYDVPYKPGTVVEVFPGDEVTFPGGEVTVIDGSSSVSITSPQPIDLSLIHI